MAIMAVELRKVSRSEFERRLRPFLPVGTKREVLERLFLFYGELRRWSSRMSLIGPGTDKDAIERHFGESAAADPMLGSSVQRVVDLGTGSGFPGLVLAALRPQCEFWLAESRRRKAAFLRQATHQMALSCKVLDARVGAALAAEFPEKVDLFTLRAVRFDRRTWMSLEERLVPGGRALVWGGPKPPEELARWNLTRRKRLAGKRRWILQLEARNGALG